MARLIQFKLHSQIQCYFVVLYYQQWSCKRPHIVWSQVQLGPNSYTGWLCCLCLCYPLGGRRHWQLDNSMAWASLMVTRKKGVKRHNEPVIHKSDLQWSSTIPVTYTLWPFKFCNGKQILVFRQVFELECVTNVLEIDILPIDRVRPCLSLCLSNIISLRGCFSTYSSALCMRPKELRRLSLTPLTSVVTSLSSTNGDMPRKRGTISKNTCERQKKVSSHKIILK